MKISGMITAEDHLDALILHRSADVRKHRYFCAILAIVGIATFFLNEIIGMGFFLFAIIFSLLEITTTFYFLPKKSYQLHAQQKDFLSPFTYTWSPDFMEGQGISGQSKRPWSNYVKYKEGDKLFLLYCTDYLFEIVPKRWFDNSDQISEFRSLLTKIDKN